MVKIVLRETNVNKKEVILGNSLEEEFIGDVLFGKVLDEKENLLFLIRYEEIAYVTLIADVKKHEEVYYEDGTIRDYEFKLNNVQHEKMISQNYIFGTLMGISVIKTEDYLGLDKELEVHKWVFKNRISVNSLRYIDMRKASIHNNDIEKTEKNN